MAVRGSILTLLGCRRQAVLSVDVDHLADDGQAHEGAHDLILFMLPGQGSDDASTDVLTAECPHIYHQFKESPQLVVGAAVANQGLVVSEFQDPLTASATK